MLNPLAFESVIKIVALQWVNQIILKQVPCHMLWAEIWIALASTQGNWAGSFKV